MCLKTENSQENTTINLKLEQSCTNRSKCVKMTIKKRR